MYPLSQVSTISRQKNAVAGGQTDQDGAILDQSGFDSITGLLAMGAVTDAGVVELQLRGSPNADGSASVLEATTGPLTAATYSNLLVVLDVVRPVNRYVFFRTKRSVQNIAIDSVIAIQGRPRSTAQLTTSATVANQTTAVVG